MGGSEGAGRSAQEWGRRLRAQAARLEAQARRVEQGARGERVTGAVLDPLSGDGWYVLHDLAVPGSSANIDHVAVTAAGVFVIDSKAWTGVVSDGKDTLWMGPHGKSRELATLAWETEQVTNAVSTALPGWPVPVRPVISLTDATLTQRVLTAGPVTAVAVKDLVAHLSSFPPALSPHQITAVAQAVGARLPSKSGLASAMVTPDPVPPWPSFPPAPPPGWAAPPPGWSAPPPGYRAAPPPPARHARRTPPRPVPVPTGGRGRSLGRTLGGLAAGLVAIFVGLGIIGALVKHAGSSLTTFRPTVTTAGPAALQVTWRCPVPGHGWTAVIAWPGGVAPGGTTAVEVAATQSGPWSLERTFQGNDPVELTGVRTSTPEWVRAGSLVTLQVSGSATMQGQLVAPAGC